jgi:hypothetical protein
MNIANLYRKIKQILNDSNAALVNKGLNAVDNLSEIPSSIANIESINKLTYVLSGEIIEVTENDLDGISTIGDYAFAYCTNLKNITIPNSITTIGNKVFFSCNNLTDIYLKSITPPVLKEKYTLSDTMIIHVPTSSGDAYKSATNWSRFASQIIEDVEI